MKRDKRGFGLLVVVFSALGLAVWGLQVVFYAVSPNQEHHASMMGASMSEMMRQHVEVPTSLGELLARSGERNSLGSIGEGHHPSQGIMGLVHNLTTSIIYFVLPLIIGGTAFLLINWIFLDRG